MTERRVRAAIADSEFAAAPLGLAWRPAAFLGLAVAFGVAVGLGIQWLVATPQTSRVQAPPAQPAAAAPPGNAAELEAELELQDAADAIAQAEAAAAGETLLSQSQRLRLQAYSTDGYKLLTERLAATRELLERAPDQSYALELFVTDNPEPARMERFLLRARDLVPLSEVFLIPIGSQRLRVIYGTFDNPQQALEAERRLPPRYQQAFRTSARSFGELRKQM